MDIQLVLVKALQLLCCLSLLVVLHEGGHFGFSKLFGVKVEKFYMFFDYKFHLFSTRNKWFTRLFPHFKDNETEYGIGWIPLGGYVKIAGMIDESMDTEQMQQPAKPNEFRSQKVWKRFLIMFGGVLMNFLTAWFIYSAVMFVWGRDVVPIRSFEQGFQYNEMAHEIGFRDGDVPIAIDDMELKEYNPGPLYRSLSNASLVTVLRQGKKVTLQMPEEGLNMLELIQSIPPFLTPYAESLVDSVLPGTAEAKAGIKQGACIMEVNGYKINTWADYDYNVVVSRQDVLEAPGCSHQDSLRQRTMCVVFCNSGAMPDTVQLQLDEDYTMGIVRAQPVFKTEHVDYTLFQCIPAGLQQGWRTMVGYVSDLKYVASADGAKSVGSFITIGNVFPSTWDWHQFWLLTAFISIILAVMNILPIPGLDGGHIVFLLYEGITGRQPSDKAAEWFEKIGIGILCLLMLLAMSNDVRNFILPLFGF